MPSTTIILPYDSFYNGKDSFSMIMNLIIIGLVTLFVIFFILSIGLMPKPRQITIPIPIFDRDNIRDRNLKNKI